MKIVFNREGKKHVCSTCFRPFDWDENSWAFYKNLDDDKEASVFCSDKCKRRQTRKKKIKCQKKRALRLFKMK